MIKIFNFLILVFFISNYTYATGSGLDENAEKVISFSVLGYLFLLCITPIVSTQKKLNYFLKTLLLFPIYLMITGSVFLIMSINSKKFSFIYKMIDTILTNYSIVLIFNFVSWPIIFYFKKDNVFSKFLLISFFFMVAVILFIH